MTNIQLEFNINNVSDNEMKLSIMQKQIDQMSESTGKVRRKLFSEIGEMKKLYNELKMENQELKMKLREINNEKTEWVYATGDYLFDVRERAEACG
jgi:regulator of replication initiation timing